MNILFCVFSGTGNTRRVAETLAARLAEFGHTSDLHMIKNGVPMPAVGGYDLLIAGYPVHAFNAPTAALKFLKQLPPSAGMPVYLLRTSGEPSKLNDASGIEPRRILKKKGYEVKGEFTYVMPYNIIFRHSDGMVARMWQAALARIARARWINWRANSAKWAPSAVRRRSFSGSNTPPCPSSARLFASPKSNAWVAARAPTSVRAGISAWRTAIPSSACTASAVWGARFPARRTPCASPF